MSRPKWHDGSEAERRKYVFGKMLSLASTWPIESSGKCGLVATNHTSRVLYVSYCA